MYDIGWAVTALNDEKRVRRAAWNEYAYLIKTEDKIYMVDGPPLLWDPTQEDVITPDWGFA